MSQIEDLSFLPEQFSGRARLFPLPNLVLFPHVMQPLHVFEPRYRQLLEDALESDGLITMTLLSSGWEKEYEGRPPICPTGCLGRVVTHERQPDGRCNILLLGLRRVRLTKELPPARLFREAEAEVLEDLYPPGGNATRHLLQRKLVRACKEYLPRLPGASEQLDSLLGDRISMGMLTDVISYALDAELELKQTLLDELDVDRRAALLLERLRQARTQSPSPHRLDYPPNFSTN